MTSSNDSKHDANGRPTARRSRRRRPDRGLPDDGARLDLAKTYVEVQHRLWPDLVRAKLHPPRSPKAYAEMADEFRNQVGG